MRDLYFKKEVIRKSVNDKNKFLTDFKCQIIAGLLTKQRKPKWDLRNNWEALATLQNRLSVAITSNNIHDSVGATNVFEKVVQAKYDETNLQHLFIDSGYRLKLKKWVKKELNMDLTVVRRIDNTKN